MKLIKNFTPRMCIEYKHFLVHNGNKYVREEVMVPKCFKWEGTDKLIDLHTISWRMLNDGVSGPLEYYSNDSGWAKDHICAAGNPVPELEQIFKKGIGKDLIYFDTNQNDSNILESEDFYNVMQVYRHTPLSKIKDVARAFEDVKTWIKENYK